MFYLGLATVLERLGSWNPVYRGPRSSCTSPHRVMVHNHNQLFSPPPPLPSRQKDGQKATDPTDDLTLVDPIIYPFSFWKKKTTTF